MLSHACVEVMLSDHDVMMLLFPVPKDHSVSLCGWIIPMNSAPLRVVRRGAQSRSCATSLDAKLLFSYILGWVS